MRFVPVKSGETQGAASVFRVRELLIRQRTQAINAQRGHLGECGWVVPQGAANVRRLVAVVADEDLDLPEAARASLQVLTAPLAQLDGQFETLDAGIDRRARENKVARRLMGSARRCLKSSTGGICRWYGPSRTPRHRPADCHGHRHACAAAWSFPQGPDRRGGVTLGLAPRQHSTGGKQEPGATTTLSGHCVRQCPAGQRMGERSLRLLLIIGASSVIIKQHCHTAAREDAGEQAADAGPRGPCEQRAVTRHRSERIASGARSPAHANHGVRGLAPGADGECRDLPGAGHGGASPAIGRETPERKGAGSSLAQRSRDGIGRPGVQRCACEHAASIWTSGISLGPSPIGLEPMAPRWATARCLAPRTPCGPAAFHGRIMRPDACQPPTAHQIAPPPPSTRGGYTCCAKAWSGIHPVNPAW